MEKFKFVGQLTEDHKQPVFCVTFNEQPAYQDIFASVGANGATVYRCHADSKIEELQQYADGDKEERFFVCKWTEQRGTMHPLLLIAGLKGLVRVLDCTTHSLIHTFAGHGSSINDINVLPGQPSLFLTASKDEAIRLWNLETRSCVLILSGEGGHTNEILTLSTHPKDPSFRILSGAMDNCVKVWSLEEHASVLEESFHWSSSTRTFPTKKLAFPRFSSDQVHTSYVDCVRWLGSLCLSKSVDERILLWKPLEDAGGITRTAPGSSDKVLRQCKTSSAFMVLQEYILPHSHVWFVRFSLDFPCSILACGNGIGTVFVWSPSQVPATLLQELNAPASDRVVRQTAVSPDGRVILASNDAGIIFRFDKRPISPSNPASDSDEGADLPSMSHNPARQEARPPAGQAKEGVAGVQGRRRSRSKSKSEGEEGV